MAEQKYEVLSPFTGPVPLLQGLPASIVDKLVRVMQRRTLRQGERLITEGEPSYKMFLVASGTFTASTWIPPVSRQANEADAEARSASPVRKKSKLWKRLQNAGALRKIIDTSPAGLRAAMNTRINSDSPLSGQLSARSRARMWTPTPSAVQGRPTLPIPQLVSLGLLNIDEADTAHVVQASTHVEEAHRVAGNQGWEQTRFSELGDGAAAGELALLAPGRPALETIVAAESCRGEDRTPSDACY